VGIGCRFPGGIVDVESFWRFLSEGRDAISEIPKDRIDIARYFDSRAATPGRMTTRWGGFLDHIDEFDADFFGISPREAERLDPQQRLLLETAWEALEDAGQDVSKLDGTRTGVFIGQWASDFEARLFADPEALDFYVTQGSGRYAASGRISYALGLRGPSLTLDTACSSSLVAVHLAVRSIRSGESRMALAGGANIILQPHITIAYSQVRMMAESGRCRFGDASGDGYVRSEGVGLVVLKALDQALADGDRIYAVVRGSATNNDGRSSGSMGRPSQIGHAELLRSAYRDASVPPALVGYVEAHGTGTRAGDPVELGALAAVLGEGRENGNPVLVGSVKTNFGHTEAAAGVAGLIKAALVLHHGTIPPSLHFASPNPAIPWADLPLAIAGTPTSWPAAKGPRLAGVNGFGISGTNAHVVLEEAPRRVAARPRIPGRAGGLLPLSARSLAALRGLAIRVADLLEGEQAPCLHDLCWSAATRRTPLDCRAAFVARDAEAMREALRSFAEGGNAAAQGIGSDSKPKIAFICPGQGAQWDGMARQLLAEEPAFRAALELCDEAARSFVDWSIIEQLSAEPGSPSYRMDQIDVIQPVMVALAIAYAALWRSLGIEPDAVVGHSMGEVAAACIAGTLELKDAMRIICRRSALMRRTSGAGAMALVDLSIEEAKAYLSGRDDRLSVAVSNSPRSSVISGDPEALAQVMAQLTQENVFCRLVKVDVASHSPQMEPLAAELSSDLTGLAPGDARIPIWSTVFGRRADGREFDAAYWGRNLRQTVRFKDAMSRLLEDGVSIFVELGPHPILLPSVQQTAQSLDREMTTIACGRRDEADQTALLAAFGQLWAAGYSVEWERVMPERGDAVRLPHYPWQRERYWAEWAEFAPEGARERIAGFRPDDQSRGWLYQFRWEQADLAGALLPPVRSRWLVVSADPDAASAFRAVFEPAGATCTVASLDGLETAVVEFARKPGVLGGIILLAADDSDAPYLPIRVLQAVLAAEWTANPRLWAVTRGAQSIAGEGKERVSVDGAALWGTGRVIAEEHPELWGGLVDLDPADTLATQARALILHLLAADGEDQAAFRSGVRYVLRLAVDEERDSRPPAFVWRTDAAYLITGGLGGVGLHVARALAAQGVRRLILLGRTTLPPREEWSKVELESPIGRRISAIRALESDGVAVHADAVDVADETQLRVFLDRYAAEAWPPIRGVIHAAGSLENHLTGTLKRSDFEAVLGPKLRGAQLLDRLLPDLDLFVLFSSTGAFLAQPGQANYAAANAGLDALAADRRARGLPALSIGWGVWDETGLVRSAAGASNVKEMARQGIMAFSPERGTRLFTWLCGRGEYSIAVLPIDWAAFQRARGGRDFALFRGMLARSPGAAVQDSSLGQRLAATAAPGERRQLFDGVVREAVCAVLKIVPARLDPRKALGNMGLTSLMAMELRNRLEAAIGRPISATLAWNYPTVDAIVNHLAGAEAVAATNVETTRPQQPVTDLSDRISRLTDLSDDEAVAALRA
jgi:acyl transferase domain-containing protein